MFKILGSPDAVTTNLGDMTQGIGFPLRPVEDATTTGMMISAPRQLFDAESLVTQAPTTTNVEQRIELGPAINTAEASVDALGTVTTHVDGVFRFRATFSLARTTSPGGTITPFTFKINGVMAGTPLVVQLTDSATLIPFQFEADIPSTAGTTYDLWFYRDVAGNNDGSLVAQATALYGTAASAGLTVSIYDTV